LKKYSRLLVIIIPIPTAMTSPRKIYKKGRAFVIISPVDDAIVVNNSVEEVIF